MLSDGVLQIYPCSKICCTLAHVSLQECKPKYISWGDVPLNTLELFFISKCIHEMSIHTCETTSENLQDQFLSMLTRKVPLSSIAHKLSMHKIATSVT